MKLNTVVRTVLALGSLLFFQAFADEQTDKAILEKLQELTEKLEAQDKKIDQQNKEIERLNGEKAARENNKATLDRKELDKIEVESAYEQVKESNVLKLSSYTSSLEFSGDLRIRNENRTQDDDGDRNRWRTRFRLGSKWKSDDGIYEIGAGFATGDDGSTSTNDTWSDEDVFDTGDLRLDYAYLKAKLSDDVTIIGGQQKNPFLTSKLFWDGDIRPIGFTVAYGKGADKKYKGAFATAGYYVTHDGDANDGAGSDNGELLQAQAGFIGEAGENGKFKAAIGIQIFDSSAVEEENGDEDAAYDIVDIFVSYDTKVGDAGLSIWAHGAMNIGADGPSIIVGGEDADEHNVAYVIGADVKIQNFKFGAHYVHIEADSLYPELVDSDYDTGLGDTDSEAIIVYGKYYIKKNLEIAIKFIQSEEIEAGSRDRETIQTDIVYKF